MKDKSGWFVDTIKYSLLWVFGLGVATAVVVPFYGYLLDTIGGWVYLGFVFLGFLTKLYFVKKKAHEDLRNAKIK